MVEEREHGTCTDLLQMGLHNLGPVVHSQNNIGDTSLGKGLDLVLNHRLVGKLDEWFGKSQGLCCRRRWSVPLYSLFKSPLGGREAGDIPVGIVQEVAGGCRSHPRE